MTIYRPTQRLGIKVLTLVVAAVALGSIPIHVAATPIFSQTFSAISGRLSDADTPTFTADNFSIGAADTVRSVSWQGFYYSNGSAPALDDFAISFYSDNSGSVGGLIQTFNVDNNVNRVGTGVLLFNNASEFFNYTADLGTGISLGAGAYWISVFNDTTADTNDSWYWSVELGNGNPAALNQNGSWRIVSGENYFVLDNENLSAVPEPSSLALLGFGLAGFGYSRRKAS